MNAESDAQYSGDSLDDAWKQLLREMHHLPDKVGDLYPIISQGKIDKYEIRELVSVGGQAVTLRAVDPDLQRAVLLKISHSLKSIEHQNEILQEGRALARVHSEHVAECYAAVRFESRVFLVIEFIAGESLAERLDDDQFLTSDTRDEVTREIMEQVSRGLSEVHACGLLHRDLKPANIMLDEKGRPKIVDFGLATWLGDADVEQTRGTPAYMAPEQAREGSVRIDLRTDVFGAGATMYEMLTGVAPFDAPTKQQRLELARRGEVVPVAERRPEVGSDLARICMRCLDPVPENRYASAQDLHAALVQSRQPDSKRAFNGRSVVVVLMMVLACALSVMWLSSTPPMSPLPAGTGWIGLKRLGSRLAGRVSREDFFMRVEINGVTHADDGLRLVENRKISFRIESERDAYLGIFSLEDDQAVQLFPNRAEPDALVRANQARTIPGDPTVVDEQALDIKAKYSGRKEILHVFAATVPWKLAGGRQQGPFLIFEDPAVVEKWMKVRGFKGVARESIPKVLIAEYRYPYLVEEAATVEHRAPSKPQTD